MGGAVGSAVGPDDSLFDVGGEMVSDPGLLVEGLADVDGLVAAVEC